MYSDLIREAEAQYAELHARGLAIHYERGEKMNGWEYIVGWVLLCAFFGMLVVIFLDSK